MENTTFRGPDYTVRGIRERGSAKYLCCMSSASSFVTYISHKRFCDRLAQAARNRPIAGTDPIFSFIEAAATGGVIDWRTCGAVADRMEELAKDWPSLGELARPAHSLAHRLRSAASAEMPFCMR